MVLVFLDDKYRPRGNLSYTTNKIVDPNKPDSYYTYDPNCCSGCPSGCSTGCPPGPSNCDLVENMINQGSCCSDNVPNCGYLDHGEGKIDCEYINRLGGDSQHQLDHDNGITHCPQPGRKLSTKQLLLLNDKKMKLNNLIEKKFSHKQKKSLLTKYF